MGAGAIGGIYGTLLALRGHEVTFVARGAQLEAMQTHGLEVRTPSGTHHLQPVTAVERPADASGPVDLVLFTVKGYDTEEAATALRPAVGPQTVVLTLQNGVESADRLAEILTSENILAGATYVAATTTTPGVIDQVSAFCRIVFGEPGGGITPRVEAIAAVLQDAGIEPPPVRTPPPRSGRNSSCKLRTRQSPAFAARRSDRFVRRQTARRSTAGRWRRWRPLAEPPA